jgi:hypothetical protein
VLTPVAVFELPAPPDVVVLWIPPAETTVFEALMAADAEAPDFGVPVAGALFVGAALTLGGAADGEEPSMVRCALCAVYSNREDN